MTDSPPTPRAARPRARDLGVLFDGASGPLNAVTDVAGVEVGHTTLIRGDGRLLTGKGPVRTGVTVLLPRGHDDPFRACPAAWYALNGNGEMTGTASIDEFGLVRGPIAITNTHSVGVVRDALVAWHVREGDQWRWHLPVVTETYDGVLNDIDGFHVKPEHVWEALDRAHAGSVDEGNVGGGTGMISYQLKAGIGTASRRFGVAGDERTVGVLVQSNFGARRDLRIAGVPVGPALSTPLPETGEPTGRGSIIVVLATDVPLSPGYLKALLRRAAMGLARCGSIAETTSGDIFLAFSTADGDTAWPDRRDPFDSLPPEVINPVFRAAVETTEEAVVNAMVAAETMTGRDGIVVPALPHDELRDILCRYNRLGG